MIPPGAIEPALEMRGITKWFGSTQALDGVDFYLRAGTVHALLGENGAGKSTLMHVAHGLVRPDAGQLAFGSTPAPDRGARRARTGMVHQHLSLVPTMTAEENLELGERGRLRLDDARRRIRELSASSGLAITTGVAVQELSIVEQQRVEIVKALARDAEVLILDEPTAVLAPKEAAELLAWIRAFAQRGGSVVLVTHKLREALAIADEITVLRRGRMVWTGAAGSVSERELAASIFPDAPAAALPVSNPPGEVVVRATMASFPATRGTPSVRVHGLELRRGEIVGIAAVEGSGHREFMAALAGLRSPGAGTLDLPREIAFVPADRRREAIVPAFTLSENAALRGLGSRRGRIDWADMRERTSRIVERFAITAPSVGARASALSGGNQQRLVLGRELERDVDLVVADNPTRGLDMQASAFLHDQLRRAAARGAAVVVHSSDLDEVLALATRVLVVFHGEVREVAPDRDVVGQAMLGAA